MTAYPFRRDSEDALGNIIDLGSELVPGYPASATGQTRWMNDVASVVKAVPHSRGLGVFHWEATWTARTGNGWDPADPSSGDGWENQALFGYDDRLLPATAWFRHR
ncbi:arabinogalactan endo-1,4-beta-galactosidase [Streptomyces calvus]